jgi:hypothetical protein
VRGEERRGVERRGEKRKEMRFDEPGTVAA